MSAANRLEVAASAAAGPLMVNIAGYDVPLLAAILSLACVILTSSFAPPPARPLSRVQSFALVGVLCIFVLALVISDPTRSLFVSTCWAIGIGYAGLPIVQAIKDRIFPEVADVTAGDAIGDQTGEP